MAQYINVRLKTGENLVAVLSHQTSESLTIDSPVEINIDYKEGFIAKAYLLLAKENFVTFLKDDILYWHDASEIAIQYYEEYIKRLSEALDERDRRISKPSSPFDENDLEESLEAMLESKLSIKH